jgi:hypothetical protein
LGSSVFAFRDFGGFSFFHVNLFIPSPLKSLAELSSNCFTSITSCGQVSRGL